MDDLKEILFERAVKSLEQVDRDLARDDVPGSEIDMALGLYRGLYDIFVDVGIEEEYQNWKRENGYMDRGGELDGLQ